MAERRLIRIKHLKENIAEITLLIGVFLVSIGFFIWSVILGFISTGLMFMGLTYLVWLKGGD